MSAVAEKTQEVTFRARGGNLVIVVKPDHYRVEQDGSRSTLKGRRIEFAKTGGDFTTDDPELIALLRERPGFNLEYWEVGNEPHAQPDPELVLEAILQATIDLDDAELREIQEKEQTSFQRPTVLKNVAKARSKVQARLEEEDAIVPTGGDGLELEKLRDELAAANARAEQAQAEAAAAAKAAKAEVEQARVDALAAAEEAEAGRHADAVADGDEIPEDVPDPSEG